MNIALPFSNGAKTNNIASVLLLVSAIVLGGFFISVPSAHAAATIAVPTNQSTIQAAVDAAADGDTIMVAAGIYPENVVINNKQNLTIQGVGNTTVIEPASGIGFSVTNSSGLVIKGLKIHTTGTNAHGIWVAGTPSGGAAVTGLTVQDNTIVVDGYSSGIYAEWVDTAPHSGWVIGGVDHGNILEVNSGTGVTGDGMDLYDVSNSEVSYNTITLTNPTDSTSVIWSSELSNLSNLKFEHNTVSGSSGSEVWIGTDFSAVAPDTTVSTVSVLGNTFGSWGSRALKIEGSVTGTSLNSNTFQVATDTTEVVGGSAAASATGSGNVFNVSGTAKIQKAIDAARSGDTINVAAGTYTEDLSVPSTKTGLNIAGAATSTTSIVGVATLAAASFPLADPNIEILGSGTHLHGFTIKSPVYVSGNYSSGIVIGASNVEINGNAFLTNTVNTTDDVSQTIQTYSSGAVPGVDVSGLNVHDNSFAGQGSSAWGYEGIYINPDAETSTVTVDGNLFSGNIIRAITSERSKTVITNNVIQTDAAPTDASLSTAGSWQGINVRNLSNSAQSDVTVTGNTISGSDTGYGFLQGIRAGHSASQALSTFTIQNNTISGNTTGLVVLTSGSTINAANNYWGSETPDFGTLVSGSATTEPYWLDAAMTISSATLAAMTAASDTLTAADITNNLGDCATVASSTACTGLYFEKAGMGKIEYNVSLDMTDADTVTLLQSLGTALTMNQGAIGLNASTAAMMQEAGATISIYGLDALGYTSGTAPAITVLDDSGSPIATSSPSYPALGSIQYSSNNGGTLSFTSSHFTTFETKPTVTETTPVSSPTSSTTPAYVFTTDTAGALAYGGSCTSATVGSVVGENTITLMQATEIPGSFGDGTYSDCTITVTDGAGHSTTLAISPFTVDTTAPVIASLTSSATAPGALKVGDTITFTLTPSSAEADGTVSGSYNGVTLTWSTSDGGVTYTATYTVAQGNSDQASALQISGVTLTDTAGNVSAVAASTDVAKTIDAHAPTVTITVDNSVISPNASAGVLDSASIDIGFSESVSASIDIKDAGGTVVRNLYSSGSVTNPNSHSWNGKDDSTAFVAGGTYTVSVSGTDPAGNNVTNETYTIVVDNTNPVIASHADITADSTSNAGATVIYTAPNATDNRDATAAAACNPASGSLFVIGSTTVVCSKTDSAGNTATSTFAVAILDKTPPTITLSAYDGVTPTNQDITVTATTDEGSLNSGSHTFTGNGSFDFVATDTVGNAATTTVTITNIDKVLPTVTKLGDGNADFSIATGTTADLVFSEPLTASSKMAAERALTLGASAALSYSWSEATLAITAPETGVTFANDVKVASVSDAAGNASGELTLVDSAIDATQAVPDATTGAVTINSTTPEVVVTSPTQAITVTVGSGTTDASVNFDALITNGTGTIPATTINTASANVAIPTSTVVTSADASWNGVMSVPTVTTVALPVTGGQTKELSTAVEVGFSGAKLSFSNGVRLLLPGQAGKRAGYVRTGESFVEITAVCVADNQTTGDALAADSECKVDVGADMAIWTKHFTTFASYTQTTNPGVGGGYIPPSGGNNLIVAAISATPAVPTVSPAVPATPATPAQGRVLGAAAYNFTGDLHMGSSGANVTELQKLLIAEGFDIPAITKGSVAYGTFGGQTLSAVIAYQRAHGVSPAKGYVGTLTRAELNKGTIPTTPETTTPKGSGLTDAQVTSILGVLQSFNADADVMAKVKAALGK